MIVGTMAAGRRVLSLLLLLFCEFSSSDARRCLCLAVDTTESMETEINVLQQQLPNIIARRKLQGTAPNLYTLVSFNDPTLGELATHPLDFFFMSELNRLNAAGGGDCPDLALAGLHSALDNCNSDCAVFVITDADPKDKGSLDRVKNLIVTKRIQVNFILTGSCNSNAIDPVYYQIADFSLGLVVNVSKDEFASVVPFIDRAIDHHQRHALLVVNQVPFPKANRFVFDVLENTTVTEIYLSGPNVIAGVYSALSDNALEVERNISLPTFDVYYFKDAQPGVYLLQVESTGHTSIRVHGYAEDGFGVGDDIDLRVLFVYNNQFVTQPPLVATRLIIESYGTHHPYEIHQVELVTYQNSVAVSYDLYRFPNETSTMWRTNETFVVPGGNYYGRILGRTSSGTDFGIYAFPAFESLAEPIISTDGDPLFTVQLDDRLSMCYAVHGDRNKVYNLISTPSLNVNSFFVNRPEKPELNFHGKIGILACNTECIVASVETCELYVNGELHGETVYRSSCVEITKEDQKMSIKVLHGSKPVEMVIQCHNIDKARCLKFQVLKSDGLEEHGLKPHGLIGQFYHQQFNFTLVPTTDQVMYKLYIRGREIPAIWDHKTWNRAKMPCFYVGDSQGTGVIDGHYTDYEVKECTPSGGGGEEEEWKNNPEHCQLCSTATKVEFPSEFTEL